MVSGLLYLALTREKLDANYLHVRNISNNGIPDDQEVRSYFLEQCRSRGIRVTTQRLAVFQALAQTADHPTADSLYARLRKSMPALSLSTVYRILESLEGEGLIRRVISTNGIVRYDGNHRPHQHLVCRVCGRIIDITDASLSELQMPRVDLAGFVAEELEIRIVGTCTDCLSALKSLSQTGRQKGKLPGGNRSPAKRRKGNGRIERFENT